mmetsp:Transcript_31379/g.82270  ORF Transcript_31379/g.82270 Transcript_31379/m.82270 type:complete len:91 (-) Transcript_31379:312-584(-)
MATAAPPPPGGLYPDIPDDLIAHTAASVHTEDAERPWSRRLTGLLSLVADGVAVAAGAAGGVLEPVLEGTSGYAAAAYTRLSEMIGRVGQ